ncbi:MAG: hypothetical protein IKE20_07760 [Eggerthellaceae bacterium]|nr:hypothetical protein [Eggerthellaceae bacterium]
MAKEVRDFDDKGDQQERLTKAWSCELLALLAVTRPVIPDYISALSYCDEAIELGGVDAFPLKMRIEQHAANKAKDIGKSFIENVLTRL